MAEQERQSSRSDDARVTALAKLAADDTHWKTWATKSAMFTHDEWLAVRSALSERGDSEEWWRAIELHKIECQWIGSGWRCYVRGTSITHGSTLQATVAMMVRAIDERQFERNER